MVNQVKLSQIVERFDLKNLTPDVDYTKIGVSVPDVNRPALQLTGFFEHFASERVQIIGYVEYTYLENIEEEKKEKIYDMLLSYEIPCIVYCRGLKPEPMLLEKANKANVPVFSTGVNTSTFTAELIRWLNVELAPCISIHGVLVDVHRLVSDDVVEIRKVSDDTLVGKAPDITRHFIELRGIGIVDVKMLFGVQSVRETQNIDLVITLEDWNKDREYDRLGLTEEYTEFLGNKVVCHSIPIRPGRNVAIIVESAAINHRQKQMGYNAAQELYRRVQENLKKNM